MEYTRKDKDKFWSHRSNARFARGIEFNLTFEEWFTWWQETGHYHERGKGQGKYVMARFNDTGPYELGNIYCCTHADNVRHACKGKPGKPQTAIANAKRSAALKGKAKSEEHRAKLADNLKKALTARREKNKKE
ncbi:hypothetical protein ACAX43_12375 [Paraburkholderia sp. IW21]|uniref:hypothetical protein n=1 Tax=Paraburkholderia sp. IW21 TaxID=3242488 RepID=UPI003521673B